MPSNFERTVCSTIANSDHMQVHVRPEVECESHTSDTGPVIGPECMCETDGDNNYTSLQLSKHPF